MKNGSSVKNFHFGDLGEARTLDPLIKSQLLYQLSYEVIVLLISDAKVRIFFELATILSKKILFLRKKLIKKAKNGYLHRNQLYVIRSGNIA